MEAITLGATNVLRVIGKPWGFAVFFADAFKGFAAVRVALFLVSTTMGQNRYPEFYAILAAAACVDRPFVFHLAPLSRRQGRCDVRRSYFRYHAHSRRHHLSSLAAGLSSYPLRLRRFSGGSLCTSRCRRGADLAKANSGDRAVLFLLCDDSNCRLAPSIKLVSPSPRNRAAFQPEMNLKRTAILGAGSWGTALAVLWSKRGNEITLWGHNEERAARLQASRESAEYLPGVRLPPAITVTSDLADCAGADLIVVVTPSVAVRAIAENLRPHIAKDAVLLSCTKGIEHGTGMRMTEILAQTLPDHTVAVLSGPTWRLKSRAICRPPRSSAARTLLARRNSNSTSAAPVFGFTLAMKRPASSSVVRSRMFSPSRLA